MLTWLKKYIVGDYLYYEPDHENDKIVVDPIPNFPPVTNPPEALYRGISLRINSDYIYNHIESIVSQSVYKVADIPSSWCADPEETVGFANSYSNIGIIVQYEKPNVDDILVDLRDFQHEFEDEMNDVDVPVDEFIVKPNRNLSNCSIFAVVISKRVYFLDRNEDVWNFFPTQKQSKQLHDDMKTIVDQVRSTYDNSMYFVFHSERRLTVSYRKEIKNIAFAFEYDPELKQYYCVVRTSVELNRSVVKQKITEILGDLVRDIIQKDSYHYMFSFFVSHQVAQHVNEIVSTVF